MQLLGDKIIAVARRNIIAVARRKIIAVGRPAGLYARAGRSPCQSRPVSMPASAGLYARAGRSLCQSRPVSLPEPAGLYAGVGRSLCRPTPFRLCRRALRGVLFRQKQRPNKNDSCFYEIGIFLRCLLFWQMLT